MFRSSNPAFSDKNFQPAAYPFASSGTMSLQGTINKSFILLFILAFSGLFVWNRPELGQMLMFPALILGFILSLVIIFKKTAAGFLAPIYALCEGVVLGAISLVFERQYPGIAISAISATLAVFAVMFAVYKFRVIRVTATFNKVLIGVMGAIMVLYLVSFVGGFFGLNLSFINGGGKFGIIFSLVITAVAALSLLSDFDIIERGVANGIPKYMEWYCAFALMVTLVWLYLEILRLLSKTRRR